MNNLALVEKLRTLSVPEDLLDMLTERLRLAQSLAYFTQSGTAPGAVDATSLKLLELNDVPTPEKALRRP